ncbi:lysozyme 1B-like isoform X1 [Periplaneta americana]|uniref:lysozyme 1B-like isoform X1 n=1 Tax=Periplaneta americana TaxID=6978 RepID=UPI0037E94491
MQKKTCNYKPIMRAFFLLFVLASWSHTALSWRISPCQLAGELKRAGVPRGEWNRWVCIAKYESGFETFAKSRYDFGLFQISSLHWCGIQARGGGCYVRCDDLLRDIQASIRCARHIKEVQGWGAWTVINRCWGRPSDLPDVTRSCGL